MKALIIVGASLRLCPYALPYINALLNANYDVTALVWVRDGIEDIEIDSRVRVIEHKELLDDTAPKYVKLKSFISFRNMVVRYLRKSYDFVVVLDTQFAVLFSDILLKKYKNRFVYDMRDMSYEKLSIYRRRVRQIIKAASAMFISSDGYREYLPLISKIYTTHNIRTEDLRHEGVRNISSRDHKPIRISYWGIVRDIELQKQIIVALGNDSRFELHYYGSLSIEAQGLIDYVSALSINNVFFHGRYDPKERLFFAENTEIIHNIYSNPEGGSNPTMGNKYYDGIVYRIPQVCLKGGYMGQRVISKGVGTVIDISKDVGDSLFNYYNSIDWDAFESACYQELRSIEEEYNQFEDVFNNILQKNKLI